jgi:hypothetical protein
MRKNRFAVFLVVATSLAVPGIAQNSPLPLPSPVEKELAARASNVTEVTLGKNMLAFAAKFMNGKDKDEAATRQLIQGLDGIYVRDYEFDKEGQYSMDDIQKLRSYFETSEWSPIIRELDKRSGESTDVLVKQVNGETHGMFILDAEPKELSIVLILGPVRMEDLSKLSDIGGLSSLGDIEKQSHKEKSQKPKDKTTKDKAKTGGDQ